MADQPAIQVVEGKWYAVAFGQKPFLEECCGCSLVHRVEYKIDKGKFWVRYFPDERRTRKARKLRKTPIGKP
jgi:hypothetical protein